MTSLPTSYLQIDRANDSDKPERTHRHRRSAAISGDFDAYGLGLFSPSKPPVKDDLEDYCFDNEQDFAKPVLDFSFPKYDVLVSTPPRYFRKNNNFMSPSNSSNLNSPIKLNKKTPKTKFFLSVENTVNNDNVPDAVIDLDEVLNANLHIGDYRKDDTSDDELLSSPFLRATTSPNVFSPSSLPNQPLFHQPIQENNDEIYNDDDDELFNPPHISNEVYSNSSANSSSSSLKKPIEKVSSNSSKDSIKQSNSTPKRSGAKANRYQSFYDQSFKISNALKCSSSESLTITKPTSPKHTHTPLQSSQFKYLKDSHRLAHSSSLPTLQPQRSMKFRNDYRTMTKLSPPPSFQNNSSNSPIKHHPKPKDMNQKDLQSPRQINNSPISIISDTNTLTSNISTIQSTDHSSLASEKEKLPSSTTSSNTISSTPAIIVSNDKTDTETVKVPSSPTKKLPRRPLTPNEEKLFKETRIPPFKESPRKKGARRPDLKPPPCKSGHRKSKSFTMVLSELSPKLSRGSFDDSASMKLGKSGKFMGWFRRK